MPQSVRLRLDQAAHRFLNHHRVADSSEDTIRWYRQKLSQLSRALPVTQLEEVERAALLGFIGDLREKERPSGKKLSSAYIRGWYRALRAFFGWCRAEGYEIHPSLVAETGDHWFTLKKPASTDPGIETYSKEDLDRIQLAAGSRRNRVFFQLLAGTGLRLQEALDLEIEDVEEDEIRVRSGKGRKPRRVPMNVTLQRILHAYIERDRPSSRADFVFLNRREGQWTEWGVRSLCARLTRETGLRVHAHAFRHTFATNYLRRGGDIYRLQRILGHTTITMSLRYAHLTGADLSKDIDRLTDWR